MLLRSRLHRKYQFTGIPDDQTVKTVIHEIEVFEGLNDNVGTRSHT